LRSSKTAGWTSPAALKQQEPDRVDSRLQSLEYLMDQALALGYRWAGYALLNWADDAALLALMFC
jgi:hypothetical protein